MPGRQWIFIAAAKTGSGGAHPSLGLEAMAADPRFMKNGDRVAHRAELEAMLEKIIGDYDREPLLSGSVGVRARHAVNTVDRYERPADHRPGMIEAGRAPDAPARSPWSARR